MASVEAMNIPEIAAKIVAFVAIAVVLVPAAARRDPHVMEAYETSLLLAEIPELLSQSSSDVAHDDVMPPCVFCALHSSRPW